MKNIFFLALISFFFVTGHAGAQEFHIIPKVGMNVSNLSKLEGSSIVGLNAGAGAEILFTKRFGIEPGIMFSMQGTKVGSEKVHLNYINIPIYAKYYIFRGLNVFAGPQFGLKIFSKTKLEDCKDNFKCADFSLGLGAGYQFGFGLMASVNYNFGFINVHKNTKIKNGVFQLNIGWRF